MKTFITRIGPPIADTFSIAMGSPLLRWTVFGVVACLHVLATSMVPTTPYDIGLAATLVLPGILAMWIFADFAHWYRWLVIALIIMWIHPAVAMLALMIADVWAMNRHYHDGSRYDTAEPGATGTAHHKRK